jgi:hypothetical protein
LSQAIQFFSCFIRYNHTDKAFARRLHDTLQGHGIRCWLDEKQLRPGDDIHEEVDRGIRLWDARRVDADRCRSAADAAGARECREVRAFFSVARVELGGWRTLAPHLGFLIN